MSNALIFVADVDVLSSYAVDLTETEATPLYDAYHDALQCAVATLPPKQQAVVNMLLDGYRITDIANHFKQNRGTIAELITRAQNRLKRELKKV